MLALIAITWLALTPSPPEVSNLLNWDKANHAIAFFVLSALSFYSLKRTEWAGWLALLFYGVLIEVLQWALGYRHFELFDILADLFGIVLCIVCQPLLLKVPIFGVMKTDGLAT